MTTIWHFSTVGSGYPLTNAIPVQYLIRWRYGGGCNHNCSVRFVASRWAPEAA